MKSIRDILSGRKPVSFAPETGVLEAVEAMVSEHVGAVLILDPDGVLLGCFTERDLLRRLVAKGLDPKDATLESVMTTELYTVSPEERINAVARAMQDRHIRHVPVVEDGKPIEMLSLRDLLREHIDLKRHEVQALTAYIQGENEAPAP